MPIYEYDCRKCGQKFELLVYDCGAPVSGCSASSCSGCSGA